MKSVKNKLWYTVLGAEAALCAAFSISKASVSDAFSSAMAFPFEQLGLGLRTLSLSGTAGNIAAIVLYAALCLLPLAYMLRRGLRKRLCAEDALLVVLSTLLFAVLYLMITPGDIETLFGAGMTAGKIVLGGTVYSVLCGYVVLRTLRLFFSSGTQKLQHFLSILMRVLTVIFVYAIFFACFGELLESVKDLQAGNQGNEQALGASYFFLILQFIVSAAPYAMDIWVAFAAGRLISEMQTDTFSEAAVNAAERLSRYCKTALIVTVLSQLCFNLLQLVFTGSLRVLSSELQLPVVSVVFVLAVLLLSRYLSESKRLKDENDMFV
jgi:hypothetical protein